MRFLMAATLTAFVASADARTIRTGHYLYELPPVQEGRGADGKPAAVRFAEGRLMDGDLAHPGKTVTWARGSRMPGGAMTILFDLLADRSLREVALVTGPSGMNWHGMATVAIAYRAEDDARYQVASYQLLWPNGREQTIRVPLAEKSARYVQLRLRKFELNSPGRRPFEPREVAIRASDGEPPDEPPDPSVMLREARREPVIADRYGQCLFEEWPRKVKTDEQLAADARAEAGKPMGGPRGRFDPYGGIKEPPSFEPTGFFRVRKVDGKWWLITPEGHRYFMIGVDRVWPIVRTPFRGQGGTAPREIFAELPDRGAFPEAYDEKDRWVDFFRANLKRKYGTGFRDAWFTVMQRRFTDWGFNAGARWWRNGKSDPLRLPHTETVWLWKTWRKPRGRLGHAGGGGAIDPFDPTFAQDLEAEQKDWLTQNRNSPWIVGYIFENENGWTYETFSLLLKQKGDCAAKRAFVDLLRTRHGESLAVVNQALGTEAQSFAELAEMPIAPEKVSVELRSEFIRLASRRYYKTIHDVIREYDPNHLFLGSALSGVGCEEWAAGGIEYLDGLSFNCYSDDPALHARYDKYDKPRLLTEIGFAVFGRGMGGWGLCPSHRARGAKYRYLVENFAANPNVVGFGWFQCLDNFPDFSTGGGENYNLGLVNICDQPYGDLIDEMRKANRRVYDIRSGKAEPLKNRGN